MSHFVRLHIEPHSHFHLFFFLSTFVNARYHIGRVPINSENVHYFVEAMKFGFGDRMTLGDPIFVPNVTTKIVPTMLDKTHSAMLRAKISKSETFPPEYYKDLSEQVSVVPEDHGTSHLSVVDSQRNVIAFTTTVNGVFGSFIVSPSTGILFNDEMDDFSNPSSSNIWNFPPSVPNYIQPGKRPLSSMSPTICLKDGKPFLALGASGGSRILSAVIQVIVNVLEYGMNVMDAVVQPRFHDQLIPPLLQFEPCLPFAF